MRQSRSVVSNRGVPSVAQTIVLSQEFVKFFASLFLIVCGRESIAAIVESPYEFFRAGVPALLYLMQNNLQYVAVSYLDAATYTVTYQLKILSTALLSVWLLKRHIAFRQWLALGLLVVGVSLVQLVNGSPAGSAAPGATPSEDDARNTFKGIAAVLAATVLSGFAGVYTELILKASKVSLWVRNAQLATHSIALGLFALALSDDFPRIRSEGFFAGYTAWTGAAILNNGFGGLLIAAVIKYADNILKNFSTSISIVVTTAISANYMGLEVSSAFLIGISLVCYSTFLYSGADPLEALCRLIFPQKKND